MASQASWGAGRCTKGAGSSMGAELCREQTPVSVSVAGSQLHLATHERQLPFSAPLPPLLSWLLSPPEGIAFPWQ